MPKNFKKYKKEKDRIIIILIIYSSYKNLQFRAIARVKYDMSTRFTYKITNIKNQEYKQQMGHNSAYPLGTKKHNHNY